MMLCLELRAEMYNLSIWMSINYLFLNTEKTVLMLFSPLKLQMPLPDIYFSGNRLEWDNNVKYLGTVIDSKLTFDL